MLRDCLLRFAWNRKEAMEVHEGNNNSDTTNENSPPRKRRKGQTQIAFVEDSKKGQVIGVS